MLAKLILSGTLAVAVAFADDADDGPGRGVARISLINGDVSVKRGDSGDFVAAAINAPLVVQDRVLTGSSSRTELQFDWANMIRIGANAEVRLAELEHRRYTIQIAKGTVTFRVLRDIEADVELSTPSISVRPVKRGTYRITVNDDGATEVTVRSGEAEIFTPRGSERLRPGKTMYARGTPSDPEFRTENDIREDEWDEWNKRRDKDLERSRSYDYISRDIYGAEDLDGHGRWVYVQDHGNVWAPTVAPGWAPYRHGRWSWIDWYGWSWVSYDPWGWAPYHYGRWFHSPGYGWCWAPGQRYSRHYWSPGLVAFVGFGNVGVGFGFGRVGWIPLAPYEPYHRWYGNRYYSGYRNRTYIDNSVNIVNNVNIRNVYRNSRVDNGITGIDRDGFSRGRGGSSLRLGDADFTRASVVRGQVPISPERQSLRMADREATHTTEARSADRFYSRRPVAQVDRVPFEEQRRGIEQTARTMFSEERRPSGAIANDAGRGWRRMGELAPATNERRFGEPVTSGNSLEPRRADRGESSDGWRRFGGGSVSPDMQSQTPGRGSRSSVSDRRMDMNESGRRAPEARREMPRAEVNRSEDSVLRSEPRESWRPQRSAEESRGESRSMPNYDAPSRRSDSPRMERRNEQPVRISPPIVQERSMDRAERGDRGGDRGMRQSAPPVSDGGGRGAARGGGDSGQRGGGGEGRSGGRGR